MARDAIDQEAEADYFAMCLLMPEPMLRVEAKKLAGRGFFVEDVVRMLARQFAVSDMVMTLRMQQLGMIAGLV